MHDIVLFGEVLADCFPDQVILGGAPYNVARHLHAFKQRPTLISKAGADHLKDQLFSDLSRLGINPAGIQIDAVYSTGQVIVSINNETHHFDIRPNQAYDYINAQEAINVAMSINPRIIYFGTLAQRSNTSSSALHGILSNIATPSFVDINLRAPWYNKTIIEYSLRHANYVKTSEEELAIIAELFLPTTTNLKEAALSLIQQFDLTTLFVTCGESGAWALSRSGEYLQVPGQQLNAALIDTVGAGDAFSAVCILGILFQWPMNKIINKANTFAAEICKIRGAVPETNDLYLPFIVS